MELSLFQRKEPVMVGVDISSASVKLLELSHGPQGYRVESYALEAIPADVMQEKEIKNLEALGMAVERAVKRSHTKIKNAAIAVSGSAVFTKVIQMNASLKGNELLAQIQLEAERYIPHPLDEVNIDFQVLGTGKNADSVDVFLAASRTELIDNLVEILNIGGLTAKVVDIEAYSLERSYRLIADQLPTHKEHQTIAIIDVGAITTNFSVLRDNITIYTREQIFGGKQLIEEIQRRFGLTYEEALWGMKQGGLPDNYVPELLEPFKEAIIQQIRRALQLFFSASQVTEVDHIVLAGGTVTIPGLAQHVTDKLGITALIANPFVNMSIAPRVSVAALHADAPALMICCGLALRSFMK